MKHHLNKYISLTSPLLAPGLAPQTPGTLHEPRPAGGEDNVCHFSGQFQSRDENKTQ